jgi:Spy/CpxP family protein refolding chaperone
LSRQEVQDYLNGKGLGYAKAAEMNHYPGPRHVLDMSRELSLSEEQATRTQSIFDDMQTQAIALGMQLVKEERELDLLFASSAISPESLEARLSRIGTLQAKIRYVHLSAHLEQKAMLTDEQVRLYDELRGYGTPTGSGRDHSH